MSQTKCGCMCHQDEFPRYAETDGIIICDDCLGKIPGLNKCETVLEDEEAEEQAIKLEYMKDKEAKNAKT